MNLFIVQTSIMNVDYIIINEVYYEIYCKLNKV